MPANIITWGFILLVALILVMNVISSDDPYDQDGSMQDANRQHYTECTWCW